MTMLSRKGDAAKRMNRKGRRSNSRLTSLCAVLLVLATVLSMPGMAMAEEGATDVGMPDGGVLITEVPGTEAPSEGASDGSEAPGSDEIVEEVPGEEVQPTGEGSYEIAVLALDAEGGADLEPYILEGADGMTLQRWDVETGTWVDVQDGEEIALGGNYRLYVHFKPSAAGEESFDKVMTWDLGPNVQCEPVNDRPLYDGSTKIGSYSLTADGHLTVTFEDSFLKGSNQALDMFFDMVVTGDAGDVKDKFPWSGHIREDNEIKKDTMLEVEKEAGSYKDRGTVEYTVEATVTQGMLVDGTLTDDIQDGMALRDIDDIHFYDAQGNDVSGQSPYKEYIEGAFQEYASSVEDKGSSTEDPKMTTKTFTLPEMPPMTEGMRVKLEYECWVPEGERNNSKYTAHNTVTYSGEHPDGVTPVEDATDSADVTIGTDQVTKTGNLETIEIDGVETEVIKWTVRIGTGKWDPLVYSPLTSTDTLGSGLYFVQDRDVQVQWCQSDGSARQTGYLKWGTDVKVSEDGKTAEYDLKYQGEGLFKDYKWVGGDYIEVTYYTTFDKSKQPSNGFENTIVNQLTVPKGDTGRVPVGEAVQKTVMDDEANGRIVYTVVADIPKCSDMADISSSEGHGEGMHYFYIYDELKLGWSYVVQNIPEVLEIYAEGKDTHTKFTFEEAKCTSGAGDSNIDWETYQVLEGPEKHETDSNYAYKNIRAFRIYFNTARYGVGSNGLEYHDSIWDIDEPTRLTIRYAIPYDAPVYYNSGHNSEPTGKTLIEMLDEVANTAEPGADNFVYAMRSGWSPWTDVTFEKELKDGTIDKQARILEGGEVEYRVRFTNSDSDPKDSSRLIKMPHETDSETGYKAAGTSKPTLIDEFDSRMEYVPGSLHVDVYNKEGTKKYASYKYIGPDSRLVSGNMLTATMYENELWLKTWSDYEDGGTHYGPDKNNLTDTFDSQRTYVFTYKLRLKDQYQDWNPEPNITNNAKFTYSGNELKDSTTVDIPSDMLQKNVVPGEDEGTLQYTLNVNALGADLVTIDTGETLVNLNSYKLVDKMSDNLELLTNTEDGSYQITVQYKDADGNWQPLTQSPDAQGINKDALNYYLGTEEDGSLYFILPDELPIQIVYTVRVNGAANSKELATNEATLYADHTETDRKDKYFDVGTSGGEGHSDPAVRLNKIDAVTDKQLEGVKFDLYSEEGPVALFTETKQVTLGGKTVTLYKVGEYTTNNVGAINKISPVEGTDDKEALYMLVETATIEGYVKTEEPIFFRFPYDGAPGEGGKVTYNEHEYTIRTPEANETFTVENPPENKLRVKKVDSSAARDNNGLEGAEFELRSAPREEAGSAVLYTGSSIAGGLVEWTDAGADGANVGTDLHLNGNTLYYLYETNAPDGYIKLGGPVEVQVKEDGSVSAKIGGKELHVQEAADGTPTMVVEIPNDSSFELPESGGEGTTQLYVLGSLLLLAAGMALVCEDRRRKASR